ncbi:MAG: hypothetical protein PVF58_02330 [Candidatus Methanofastidiosia archaeon]|jgi:hypothetical protein
MKLVKQKIDIIQTDIRHWNNVCAHIICDILNHNRLNFKKVEVIK